MAGKRFPAEEKGLGKEWLGKGFPLGKGLGKEWLGKGFPLGSLGKKWEKVSRWERVWELGKGLGKEWLGKGSCWEGV